MISIAKLKTYMEDLKAHVPGIKFQKLIIDDSELSKFLSDQKKETDRFLFFGVMPEFGVQGDEDQVKINNKLTFLLLEKTDYRDGDYDAYMEIFVRTQDAMRLVFEKLLTDKADSEGMYCGLMSWLNENSINIYPIWKKNGCNGWGIDIDLLTNA